MWGYAVARTVEQQLDVLTQGLAKQANVTAVALSGGNRPLPQPGEGDIDLFVYCTGIPAAGKRMQLYGELADVTELSVDKLAGGRWGVADTMLIAGVETWIMYFTLSEVDEELSSILSGEEKGRQDNYFYSTGRLSMMLNFRVLYDADGYLQGIKDRLIIYPDRLGQALFAFHLEALKDREDLLRAVSRQDVLFYHFALDLALDHFLQALFALNRVYFPSRKRSLQYIDSFSRQPEGCSAKLMDIVRLGGTPNTLEQSYGIIDGLIEWLSDER